MGRKSNPTLYQILQLHPAAPPDLVTSVYWRLTALAQSLGGANRAGEVALYHVTQAYQTLADPTSRAAYDLSLGLGERPPAPKVPYRKRRLTSLFGQRPAESEDPRLDYYELLRVDPTAAPVVVAEAYAIMQNHYLRLVLQNRSREEILDLLDEAHAIIADPESRRRYDHERIQEKRSIAEAAAAPPAGVQTPRSKNDKRSVYQRELPASAVLKAEAPAPPPPPAERLQAKRTTARAPSRNGVRPDAVPAPGAALPPPEPARQALAIGEPNGRSGKSSKVDGDRERRAMKIARALAVRSAGLFVSGGKGSVALARTASQRLRQALEQRSADHELVDAEEEAALLNRVSTAPVAPSAHDAASVEKGVRARLTIVEGPDSGMSYEVSGPYFSLGSDGACDASLPGLAAQQAGLLYSNGRFALYTLADSPEMRIHGDNADWALLENGDAIEVGPYTLRFESLSV